MRWRVVIGLTAGLTVFAPSALGRVFVCIENGQKVFRSAPCPDPATTSAVYTAPRVRVWHPPEAYATADSSPAAAPPPRASIAPVAIGPVIVGSPSVIESKIDGEFEGWTGETIIKLVNGQIWQQSEYRYLYHYAYMPDVLVYRSNSGYKMKVHGVDQAVRVEQLR